MDIISRIRGLVGRRGPATHIRVILRQAIDLEDDEPPWWLRIYSRPAGTMAERRPQPLIKCPEGHRFAIAAQHRVDSHGSVDPRIACPECGWAALVGLEGWAPA